MMNPATGVAACAPSLAVDWKSLSHAASLPDVTALVVASTAPSTSAWPHRSRCPGVALAGFSCVAAGALLYTNSQKSALLYLIHNVTIDSTFENVCALPSLVGPAAPGGSSASS